MTSDSVQPERWDVLLDAAKNGDTRPIERILAIEDGRAEAAEVLVELVQEWQATGESAPLDEACDAGMLFIDLLAPRVHVATWRVTAGALTYRSEVNGSTDDLRRAAELFQQAIDVLPRGDTDRGGLESNLAVVLSTLADYGEASLLDRAVEVAGRAVDDTPASAPTRPMRLATLASRHWDRYERDGRVEDFSTAIALLEEGLELLDHDDRRPRHEVSDEWASLASDIATRLDERAQLTGDWRDSDRAMRYADRSVEMTPPGHFRRAVRVNNLAVRLANRWDLLGNSEDLDRAIALLTEAVGSVPPTSPFHPAFTVNLANRLEDRFDLAGDREDLDRAISLLDAVVDRAQPAYQVAARVSLANRLLRRFEVDKDVADIERAVALLDHALATTPPEAPHRLSVWHTKARALAFRYSALRERKDLDDAVRLTTEILRGSPAGSADRPRRLVNFADLLLRPWMRDPREEADPAAHRLARAALDEAMASQVPAAVVRAARYVIEDELRDPHTADWTAVARAGRAAISAARSLVTARARRVDKERALGPIQQVGAVAALAHVRRGDREGAIDVLERSAAVLLAEQLGAYATEPGGANGPSIGDVGSVTAADAADAVRAPVAYVFTTRAGGGALVVRPGGATRFVDLPELGAGSVQRRLGAFDDAARRFEHALRDGAGYGAAWDAFQAWSDEAAELLTWCWTAATGPLLDEFGDSARAAVIPVGSTARLPLTSAGRRDGRRWRWVFDERVLTVAPSAMALLAAGPSRVPDRAPALVVGHPGGPPAPLRHTFREAREVATAYGCDPLLPRAEAPVELGRTPESPLVRREATFASEAAVDSGGHVVAEVLDRLHSARLVHLACHCVVLPHRPLDSYLVLDGPLTARALLDVRLAGRPHVTLSACDSGVAGNVLPDEQVGLPTVFLQAGASSVLATLWPVNDEAAAEIMISYAAELARLREPSAALAAALRAHAARAPLELAAFTLYGRPDVPS